MANILLEKEVIFRDDLERIFGKRTFEEEEDSIKEISEAQKRENPEENTPLGH